MRNIIIGQLKDMGCNPVGGKCTCERNIRILAVSEPKKQGERISNRQHQTKTTDNKADVDRQGPDDVVQRNRQEVRGRSFQLVQSSRQKDSAIENVSAETSTAETSGKCDTVVVSGQDIDEPMTLATDSAKPTEEKGETRMQTSAMETQIYVGSSNEIDKSLVALMDSSLKWLWYPYLTRNIGSILDALCI